ncbi:13421_t:CDS:2 [Ambispora gerdemannii]|uniref:13421_t:CDS:1 n=1 Tax=Ambispora gerdemannii TaxID=144530 RepID=A0A9N9CKY5_9GLOM|nr:13421_t:CDS:2 [Ambispora gerdemannii]
MWTSEFIVLELCDNDSLAGRILGINGGNIGEENRGMGSSGSLLDTLEDNHVARDLLSDHTSELTNELDREYTLNLQSLRYIFVSLRNPRLLVPHVFVNDIREIDFVQLKKAGVRAVAFDKDNTLTAPYQDSLHPLYEKAWESCKENFGSDNIVIVSNSAGTPDDQDFKSANEIERTLGVKVLKHKLKKPGGGESLISHFNKENTNTNQNNRAIAVIGDRIFTDVLYGNMNGMMTILVKNVVTEKGENYFARKIRRVERSLLGLLISCGVQPYCPFITKDQLNNITCN